MDDKRNEKGEELIAEYSPYVAVMGAIYGAYDFIKNSNSDTEVIEAILTPVISAIGFAIIMVVIVVALSFLNTVFDTEKKRLWGTGIVIIISTIATVLHVL